MSFQVTFVPYDERPLPALERKDRPVESMRSPAEDYSPQSDVTNTLHAAHISGEPEPLPEKSQREAGPALEVFGETIVRNTEYICFRLTYIYIYI